MVIEENQKCKPCPLCGSTKCFTVVGGWEFPPIRIVVCQKCKSARVEDRYPNKKKKQKSLIIATKDKR